MASSHGLGDYDIALGQAPVNLATAGSTGLRVSMVGVNSVDIVFVKGAGSDTNEQQTINLGAASAGSITITFAGQTTGSIAFNALAATVQTALEGLSNVDPGDIIVTGGALPATITLTFAGQYAGTNVAQVTVTPTGLTGGTVTVNTTVSGASEDPTLTLKSHAALSGGTGTDLPVITEYFVRSEATLDNDEPWTKVTQAAAATVADPGGGGGSGGSQQLVVVNVRADQLPDADNWLSLNVGDVGANSQLGAVIYIIHRQDKADPTDLPLPLR
jgi:hypothetical protein